jgi:uncharacterized RDD family membrane protein YckC
LAALVYDNLLLIALWMLGTLAILPLTGGEAIPPGNPYYLAYLFTIDYLFFCWFWTHGGQTLGMRAWRLRLESLDGSPVGLVRATRRWLLAIPSWLCLGAGFFWILFDRRHLPWYETHSNTRVVIVPPRS